MLVRGITGSEFTLDSIISFTETNAYWPYVNPVDSVS